MFASHSTHVRRPLGSGWASRTRARALTLVEVMVASGVLAIVMGGSFAALLQCRRITEGSINQNAAMTVVQGYLEQIKEAEFATVPYYSGTTLITGGNNDPIAGLATADRGKAIKTLLNNTNVDTIANADGESISDYLLISSGSPVNPRTITPGATAPTGVVDNRKTIDLKGTSSTTDGLQLRLWVWVQDASNSGIDATQVRSITIVYQWADRDGGRIRWHIGSLRSLRSAVPTV
jgi:hypothetical protein